MPEPEYHDLHVNKAAVQTIEASAHHAAAVHDFWVVHNAGKPFARRDDKTLTSWSRQVSMLFNTFFGATSTVTKDGELSLYVSTTKGFEYGLIFHPAHYRVDPPEDGDLKAAVITTRMGRYCFHDGIECFKPVHKGECSIHGTPNAAASLPIPGEWSFHS
jgi:hypothetical protein